MTDIALFGHLLGALAFVAGIALAAAAFEAARRRERPAEIAALLALGRQGALLVLLGGLLLLACGLWLLVREHLGGAGWLDAAIALFVAALALGALGGRRPKRARLLAARLADEGRPAEAELRTLLEDPLSRLANYAATALVVAILALMVFKP